MIWMFHFLVRCCQSNRPLRLLSSSVFLLMLRWSDSDVLNVKLSSVSVIHPHPNGTWLEWFHHHRHSQDVWRTCFCRNVFTAVEGLYKLKKWKYWRLIKIWKKKPNSAFNYNILWSDKFNFYQSTITQAKIKKYNKTDFVSEIGLKRFLKWLKYFSLVLFSCRKYIIWSF